MWMHVVLGHEMIDNMSFYIQCWKNHLESGRKNIFFLFSPVKLLLILKSEIKKKVQNPRKNVDWFRPHWPTVETYDSGFFFFPAYGLLHCGTRNSTPTLELIPQMFPAIGLGFNIVGSVGVTHNTRTSYGKARQQEKKIVRSIQATSNPRDSFKRRRKWQCLSYGDRSQPTFLFPDEEFWPTISGHGFMWFRRWLWLKPQLSSAALSDEAAACDSSIRKEQQRVRMQNTKPIEGSDSCPWKECFRFSLCAID